MPQFTELRLENRVSLSVVDQVDVFCELGIEANGEDALLQRDGMGFDQIILCERARPADCFEQIVPQAYEIAVGGKRRCRDSLFAWRRSRQWFRGVGLALCGWRNGWGNRSRVGCLRLTD